MKKLLSLLALPLIAFSAPALAQDTGSVQTDQSYLSLGVGVYDVFEDNEATDFRIEYRDGSPLLWIIKPFIGAEATHEGTLWGGGGFYADLKATDNIIITPSWGVGLYTDGSSDLDLDYPIEFRSQIEAAYQFYSGNRVSLSYSHMSNADLGDDNPGADTVGVYYHMPINSLF